MKKYLFLFAVTCCHITVYAQDIIRVADSLLLNTEYDRVILLADQNARKGDHMYTARLENKKAEALIGKGKLEEAEKILTGLQKSADPGLKGIILTSLGALYINQGRNDLALEALKQATTHFEKANNGNSLEAAQAIVYLGQVYKFTGKHAQAEEQMQMALTLRMGILKEDHELIAATYNDLGLVYAQIDNDKALDYYEKALTIYKKLHGEDHPKIAIANTNIAIVYRDLELYGDAINNFETSLKIWEKVYPKAHPSKAFVLYNLGETYMNMGDQKASAGYYSRALEMYRSSYRDKHPEIARVLNALGNLEKSSGKFDEALKYYQQALQANVSDFFADAENQNPRLENFYHGYVMLYSLKLKAEALEARHLEKTLKFSDLILGLKTLQSCDTLIDKLRQQSTNESDKISLGIVASEVYASGVRMAHESAIKAFKKKPYLELAFYFAEKSKSAVLLEAISESDAKSFSGIPANLLEEEKNLKSAIALTAQKLAQKPSGDEEKYLRETSFNLNRSYETFVHNLEKQFPGYFNLKFNASSPSISQLQKLLNDQTAILSYFIDDKNARLYIFQITKRSFRIIDHPLPEDFEKNITGLRNSLFFQVKEAYHKTSLKLERLLIPNKISNRINDLVILPSGRLSIIPFETLMTKKTESNENYKDLPYLLKRFNIRYEFSAGLLLQKSKQTIPKNSSIFLCAPVTFPEKDHLNELPATESEVKEISGLFASKNISSSIFTHQKANENLVKGKELKNYSLLHFATHGVVDERDPTLSRIFLQNNSDAEDGNLFAGEIYNLELDANLVTLSACQTGLGKISKGEGVIGLSRALVYAGAKSIIVSFWSVADESTANLMTSFYQHLLESNSPDYGRNLREAKLSLMQNEKYAAPYYWAPFILIGF